MWNLSKGSQDRRVEVWGEREQSQFTNRKETCVGIRDIHVEQGFPGGLAGKESACNAGDPGSISRLGRSPGEGHGNPLQYSCLENPHGQRSLAGYSPYGCRESDTTQ